MKVLAELAIAMLAIVFAAPAHATGGLVCRTAGARPIEVSVGFGHVPGAPLIATRLRVDGRTVPVTAAQWWLDKDEVRFLLIGPQAVREELLLRAKRNHARHFFDGSVWRNGQRRWVRCRDDG